ncbi:hypothetical protein Hanom_Chr06g00519941 [Helianthus anomalus]
MQDDIANSFTRNSSLILTGQESTRSSFPRPLTSRASSKNQPQQQSRPSRFVLVLLRNF